jgi:hypothetical protein
VQDGIDRERRALLRTGAALTAGLPFAGAAAPARRRALDPVMADLHHRTFRYFWDTADPDTGLAPDNWPNPDFCSVAALGFALSAYPIGVESGYVSRAAAAGKTLQALRTIWNGPQGTATSGVTGYKGFLYHFLDMKTARRFRTVELSSVDTTLFLLGALTAAAYFDRPGADEAEIRKLGVGLYERVDWSFLARSSGLVSMGWHPENGGALIERSWDRYNEGMMVYLLALASPTHPAGDWQAWAATIGGTWGPNGGEPHLGFAPLFGHQYSHCWYDFRGVADAFMRAKEIDYFENSRRATLAQRNYAIRNPGGFKDYGADTWGLTACRGPGDFTAQVNGRRVQFHGYSARGPQVGDGEGVDDGTIAPTAGGGSVAFAPREVTQLIHALRRRYGDEIYGTYGFTDSFNPGVPADQPVREGRHTPRAGWVADAYLGIDQGPILLMLENHRSGLIWDLFCRSAVTGPIVRRGLRAAGFQAVSPAGRWLAET